MSKARLRAIVVDDDPIVRKTVTYALKQVGFQCDQAVDGNDALQQLAENCYDLVVTDLRMPNGNGYALSVEILSHQPRPLVVVHSAIENLQLTNDLIALGIDDIIEKPTNYETFAARLHAMVARRVTDSEKQVQPNHVLPETSDAGNGCNDSPDYSIDNPSSVTEAIPASNERATAGLEGVNSNSSCNNAETGCPWIKEPNRRILLIDDDPLVHDELRKTLSGENTVAVSNCATVPLSDLLKPSFQLTFDIDSTFEGEEGIAKVRHALRNQRPFAMAFVDEDAGLETITRLWQEDAHLQVVIVSGSSARSWSDITDVLGIRDQLLILKRPFDSAEVAQLAASQTEKWNLARRAELHWDHMELLITERTKEIRLAHRETESRLAAISSLLIGIDTDGIIYRWNTAAEEIFGIGESEAIGERFRDLDIQWVHHQDRDSLFEVIELGDAEKITVKIIRNDMTRVIGISSYPVFDEGVRRGCLFLGMDITNKAVLEQQLQQAQKLEAVGQLAAGVAHEINTPMQYLGDNLEFLQNKLSKLAPLLEAIVKFVAEVEQTSKDNALIDEMRSALKRMKVKSFLPQVTEAIGDSRDGVQHVSRIVRAMKEFAHPGQEEKSLVDINRALESTIAVSTNEWKYVAEIATNLGDSVPLIPALAGELNQVFLNILVNAAHAIGDTNDGGSAGKGTITVSTRSTGGYVEVSIADTGTGIPEAVKQRIFDPFFTTKDVGVGTGQGLAIAHSVVVTKHGGKLWCESSTGEGTTFYIQLPVEPAEDQPCEQLEPATVCE